MPVTVIWAVGPVGATEEPSAAAEAWLKYSPGVSATTTLKWSEALPPPDTGNDPLHVSVCPEMEGSFEVIPLVEPGTYEKPAGRSSVTESSVTAGSFGLLTVIVYPS